jgi:hypothetical protein
MMRCLRRDVTPVSTKDWGQVGRRRDHSVMRWQGRRQATKQLQAITRLLRVYLP